MIQGGHPFWLSARKNLRGGGDNRPLFLKQQAIVPIVLSVVFENFRVKTPFRGQKSFFGGPAGDLPPCSRKPTF